MSYATSFTRLQQILKELRTHCPWDRKQTFETLAPLTVEETYELTDAILKKDHQAIKEELGDLLLHLIFYARLGEEQQHFTIEDVVQGICDKLVQRHPHIYSTTVANTEDEVKRNWEKIKRTDENKSILAGVPSSLPALIKAIRLQEKTKQVGFEWETTEQVKDKLQEELQELDEAIAIADQQAIEAEFGDVLFSMVNYARFLQIDPELALARTNEKFKNRFQLMEQLCAAQGQDLMELSLNDQEALWQQAKKSFK